MAFPSFPKRRAAGVPGAGAPVAVPEFDEAARVRARRRLIGAAVLLVVGVIAFPLLFETQPRPVPVDIPMVIPSREGAEPLTLPQRPGRSASGVISEAPASSGVVAAAPGAVAAGPSGRPAGEPAPAVSPAAAVPAPRAASAAVPAVPGAVPAAPAARDATRQPVTEAARPAPPPAKAAPAAPPPPAKAAAAAPAPAARGPAATPAPPAAAASEGNRRFVVQVGAFADEASARSVRQRIERLGLKTYTQEVEVQGQRRIRVRIGPFESQQHAVKVLDTLKAANLPGAVLAL